MFNATKFVVAGVIVALVGGFLLSGVLTQQGDGQLPAAGASVPASAEVRGDLLPGVDLVTEEVRPGVFRVLSDGIRGFSKNGDVRAVTVGPDGDVWVLRGREGSPRLIQLGEPGRTRDGLLPMTPTLVNGTWVRDGLPVCRMSEVTVGDQCLGRDVPIGLYRRSVTEGDRLYVTNAEIGLGPDKFFSAPGGASSEGTAWVAVFGDSLTFDGLVSYDGETWKQVPYPTDADAADGYPVDDGRLGPSVGPDGTVWVATKDEDDMTVRSWDGARWASFGPVRIRPGSGGTHFRPDGTIWFGAAVLDGESLVAVDLPRHVGHLTFGPDGNAWAVGNDSRSGCGNCSSGNLYVITPMVVAAEQEAASE